MKDRFAFGKNWQRFLETVDEERILWAERALQEMLGRDDLDGLRFLDVGSGSGLSSLAARRLGARVRSLDYDPDSVACMGELKRRFRPDDDAWSVESGDALDPAYMGSLGKYDVVYSWGVLHHTGSMWRGLENALLPLDDNGLLFVALYNDQGARSRMYHRIKKAYATGPPPARWLIGGGYVGFQVVRGGLRDVVSLRNPLRRYREKKKKRGMSLVYDWIDWIGGYPFEVARPEEVVHFYRPHGLTLERLRTCGGGLGCNEFVFRSSRELKPALPAPAAAEAGADEPRPVSLVRPRGDVR